MLASGLIEISRAGALADEPFLDIRSTVNDIGIEQGLLGMAFHPEFENNGRFFVYFSDDTNDTRLMEYRVGSDPDLADPDSGEVLLTFPRTSDRHHGGMIQFGEDGYLYLSVGDSGAASVNGQDPGTLLGTILRLDVDGGDPYAIPPGNPFDGSDGRPEVWAYGLRNPWRFWMDPVDQLIYIGDVGQSDREEIDIAPVADPGLNYGWPVVEGTRCFRRANCDQAEFIPPAYEYGHDEGCSVTGGIVYRGAAVPELDGHYFFADWCNRWVRSLRWDGSQAVDVVEWDELGGGQVNSFGYDGAGEIYITTWEGDVARIVGRR